MLLLRHYNWISNFLHVRQVIQIGELEPNKTNMRGWNKKQGNGRSLC